MSHASGWLKSSVLERLLADRRLPPGARGELGLVLGRMLRQQGEASRGYVEIERALPYLRTPRRRAQALAVLAAPDTVVGRHVDYHLTRCAEAEAAARESGSSSSERGCRWPHAMTAIRPAHLTHRHRPIWSTISRSKSTR
ncbi:hypothetical protein [Catellatospora sp. NPDC049133]|uniref:hypothetical protein n=1 Tax=Catellatospora sp. NPDC049133 TaxID=3155499 RepID=UPI0033FBCA35